jgi:biotin carboxylase
LFLCGRALRESIMKKILMLGGADIQVSAIKKAREMGHYVITCDYLPDNPGHRFSHEYHNVSTTDLDGVLALAQQFKPDGILAYASDPAALTAAYVAEKLGLPTNPLSAVEIMSRKDLFRKFMEERGYRVPVSGSFTTVEDARAFMQDKKGKWVIKPVDSSGSKGISVFEGTSQLDVLVDYALQFSRAKVFVIEEFIVKKGYQIGGDGFLHKGKLVFRCFGDIHFSTTNPLLPCSVSVPSLHTREVLDKVHEVSERLLQDIGMHMGALNFDVLVDENDDVFILEIGPRNGGNMIPELTAYCTGVDMKEYSIRACLGEDISDLRMEHETPYFSHYVLHSQKTGTVKSIEKSEQLKQCLLYEHYNFEIGSEVKRFESSANRLGIMLLKYPSKEVMLDMIYTMKDHLRLEVE